MMGATIRICIADEVWGCFLHILEDQPDIHIIEESELTGRRSREVKLRSDLFPRRWDGKSAFCFFANADRLRFYEVESYAEWLISLPPPCEEDKKILKDLFGDD